MGTNVKELYNLIDEIEEDKKQAVIDKKQRQRKWKNDERTKKKFVSYSLDALILTLIFSIVLTSYKPVIKKFNDYNIYENRYLYINGEEQQLIKNELEQELNINILESEMEEYLVFNAVLDNKFLSDQEKEVCYEFYSMIYDNPYIDKEKVYDNLLKLDVNYRNRPFFVKSNIEGEYVSGHDQINIYEDDSDNRVLRHEIVHSIFENKNLPVSFKEGMTELLVNEYFSDQPFMEFKNYPYEIIYVKMLCELVGSDTVLEAYTTDSMEPIYDEMAMIYGTRKDAKELLNDIDSFLVDAAYNDYNVDSKKFNKLFSELRMYKEYSILNSEIESVNFDEIDSLEYFEMYYKLINTMTNDNYGDAYLDVLYNNGICGKAYFSSNLMNKSNDDIKIYSISYR